MLNPVCLFIGGGLGALARQGASGFVAPCLVAVWLAHVPALHLNPTKGN